MQVTTDAFKAQTVAREQSPESSVTLQLEPSPAAATVVTEATSSWSVSRSLTSDLPLEVSLLSGTSAAVGSLSVDGSPSGVLSGAAFLSPYRANVSRRVAAEVKIRAGFAGETVPVFTGTTRTVATGSDGSARIEALDGMERLRTKVDLPFVVADDQSNSIAAARRPGLNGRWVVDYALRRCFIFAGIATGSATQVSASMAGSAYPDIGTLNRAFRFDSAAFGGGLRQCVFVEPYEDVFASIGGVPQSNEAAPIDGYLDFSGSTGTTISSLVDYAPVSEVPIGQSFTVEGYFHVLKASRPTVGGQTRIWSFNRSGADRVHCYSRASDNRVCVDVETVPGTFVTVTGPVVPEWTPGGVPAADFSPLRYLGVQVTQTSTLATVRFRVNGVTTTATAPVTDRTGQPPRQSLGIDSSFLRVRNLVLNTYPSSVPPWADTQVPTAILRASKNQLGATPATEPQSAADLIRAVTEAEFGSYEFTESGLFRWFNRDRMTTVHSSANTRRTISADGIFSLAAEEAVDSVRNRVRIPVTPVTIQPAQFVWSLGDVVSVPALGSRTIFARFDSPVVNLSRSVRPQPIGGVGQSGYLATSTRDGTGTAMTNLTITVTQLGQGAKIFLENPNAYDLWLVNNRTTDPNMEQGTPALALWGRPVAFGQQTGANVLGVSTPTSSMGQTVEVSDGASIGVYGEQSLVITESQWRQDATSLEDVANSLLAQLKEPRPTLANIAIEPDPSLQLGDRVLVTDPLFTGMDAQPFHVVGVRLGFSGRGLSQSIDLRAANSTAQL